MPIVLVWDIYIPARMFIFYRFGFFDLFHFSTPIKFILSHLFMFRIADESVIRTCGKFWVLDDILTKLKATGHRVLIFSQMVKLLNILEVRPEIH